MAALALLTSATATWGCDPIPDPEATTVDPSTVGIAGAGCSGCVALASGQSNPGSVAVDDTFVYWIDRGALLDQQSLGGAVMRTSRNGLGATVLDKGLASPDNLALDETSVYWTIKQQGGATLMKVDKDGSNASIVTTGLDASGLFVLDDLNVYWVAALDTADSGGTDLALFRSTKDGDGALPIAELDGALSLAVDDSGVYVLDGAGLLRVDKDTGKVDTLASGQELGNASNLVLDATSASWISADDYDSPSIFRIGKDGTGSRAIIPASDGLRGLATDGVFLYFTSSKDDESYGSAQGSTLWRVPVGGGDATKIVTTSLPGSEDSSVGFTGNLAIDGTHIYATGLEMNPGDVTGLGEVIETPK